MSPVDTLDAALQASARRFPARRAFVSGTDVLTYGELEDRAARFAGGLLRLGIRRGDRVAIVLDGVPDYLVAYYGTLRAGAVAVPLCPDTRRNILTRALHHAEASAVVLDATNAHHLDGQRHTVPSLRTVFTCGDSDRPAEGFSTLRFDAFVSDSPSEPASHASGDDLAMLVYTSGTTGAPKGVMLSHGGLVANTRAIVRYLELTESDRVAMVLPFFYVYGSSVLNTHVFVGGTIVMAGSVAFPGEVFATIARESCTGFSGVPSMLARLAAHAPEGESEPASLRYITQAGAAMTPAVAARVRGRFPGVRLFAMYGQAEASARLTYLAPEDLDRKMGSVGRPLDGVSIRIVAPDGRVLPAGETGEIVARGRNVMMGYWRNPEETDRVLRADGLHTGDLGRLDEEGYLYVVGRESEMIKSNGHRIAPREIEETIEQLPEVAECAVVGIADPDAGEVAVAFVVPHPGAAIDPRAVLRHCYAELPRFKLPNSVHFVDALPRTATGKLRRLELRDKVCATLESA